MTLPADSEPTSRRRSILANLQLSVVGTLVSIGGQLLTVPVFLRAWGELVYGDWLTLSALAAYMTLSDMGMQLYVVNRLTEEEVRGENEKFLGTLHSAVLLYLVVTGVACIALALLAVFAPWDAWFAGRAVNGTAARPVVVLLAAGVIASVWSGFVGALHRAHGEPHRTTAIAVFTRTIMLAATVGALLLNLSMVALALLQFAIWMLSTAWCIYDYLHRHRRPLFSFKHADWQLAGAMIAPSALFAALSVANGLTIQGSVLVVSYLLGPAAVTIFSTSRTLANTVRQGVGLLNSVAWPEFTRLRAREASTTLAAAHGLLVKVASAGAAWVVCTLWFNLPSVFELWTGKRASFHEPLIRILLIHALLQTPWWSSAVLLTATNRHRLLAYLFLVQGALTVCITPFTVKATGIEGVALGLLLVDVPLFGYLVPRWAQELVDGSPAAYFRDVYLGLVGISLVGLMITWGVHVFVPAGLPGLLAAGGAALCSVAIGGFLWLTPDERGLGMNAVRRRPATAV